LRREFTATRPNEKWAADITYVPTRQGWLYLAVVIEFVLASGDRLGHG
jgi:transposase InsO family protein